MIPDKEADLALFDSLVRLGKAARSKDIELQIITHRALSRIRDAIIQDLENVMLNGWVTEQRVKDPGEQEQPVKFTVWDVNELGHSLIIEGEFRRVPSPPYFLEKP